MFIFYIFAIFSSIIFFNSQSAADLTQLQNADTPAVNALTFQQASTALQLQFDLHPSPIPDAISSSDPTTSFINNSLPLVKLMLTPYLSASAGGPLSNPQHKILIIPQNNATNPSPLRKTLLVSPKSNPSSFNQTTRPSQLLSKSISPPSNTELAILNHVYGQLCDTSHQTYTSQQFWCQSQSFHSSTYSTEFTNLHLLGQISSSSKTLLSNLTQKLTAEFNAGVTPPTSATWIPLNSLVVPPSNLTDYCKTTLQWPSSSTKKTTLACSELGTYTTQPTTQSQPLQYSLVYYKKTGPSNSNFLLSLNPLP